MAGTSNRDLAGYASLGSGILSAFGSIQQGNAASAAAKYNAAIAKQNAALETQNAQWSGAEGEQQYGIAGLEAQQKAGNIKVAQAANGVDVDSGSALAVQKSQNEMSELNLANIRSNAARQAYGFQTKASQDLGQAALDTSEAGYAKAAGFTNAASGLLRGVAQYAEFTGGTGNMGPTGGDMTQPNSTSNYLTIPEAYGGINYDQSINLNSLFPSGSYQ